MCPKSCVRTVREDSVSDWSQTSTVMLHSCLCCLTRKSVVDSLRQIDDEGISLLADSKEYVAKQKTMLLQCLGKLGDSIALFLAEAAFDTYAVQMKRILQLMLLTSELDIPPGDRLRSSL